MPVINSSPEMARLPFGAIQTSPRIPPAGPVIETFAAPSSNTVHPAAAPNPKAGSTQVTQGGGGGLEQHPVKLKSTPLFSSVSVTVISRQAEGPTMQVPGRVLVSTQTWQVPE